MQHHSVIATIQIDFTYDDEKTTYGRAMKKAVRMAVRTNHPADKDGVQVKRIVISEPECGSTMHEWEEEEN